MKINVDNLTVILLIVLLLGLSSCANPKVADQPKHPTLIETIGNMGKTGKVIGCVFAPWYEECKRLKEEKVPHQTQEEYLEEINEDFDNLDKEIEKSKVE